MAVHHGIGDIEHVGATGVTATNDGLGTAISEATGFEFTNATNLQPELGWQPATADPDDTRALIIPTTRRRIGAFAAAVSGMDGVDAAYRVRWGDWAQKPLAPNVLGTTPVAIAETDSWTFSWAGRPDPLEFEAVDRGIAEVRATGASSNSTRLLVLLIGSTGTLKAWIPRLGGSTNEFDTGVSVDGSELWIDVSFVGAGAGGGTATIYVNGVNVGTKTITDAFGSNTIRLATRFHPSGIMSLWDRALDTEALERYRYRILVGAERGLVAGLMFTATDALTPTTVADVSGNGHTMTLAVGTWSLMANPGMAHAPAATPRHQPWRRRGALDCREAAGSVQSGLSLATSPIISFGGIFRWPYGAPTTQVHLAYFGLNYFPAGSYQFRLSLQSSGLLNLVVNQFDVSSEITVSTTTVVTSGDLIRLTFSIGWGGAITVGINGVEEGTGTAPAYTSNGASRFALHRGADDFEVCGPVFLSRRPYTHAQMDAILLGTAPLIPAAASDDVYLWYSLDGTGLTETNRGTAGSAGNLTLSSTSRLPDHVENPSASAGVMVDPSEQISNVLWEIAPGTNPECGELLLEFFGPEATTVTVWAITMLEVYWLRYGFEAGAAVVEGPSNELGAGGGIFPNANVVSENLSYTIRLMAPQEEARLRAAVARGSQIWRGGALVAAKPIAMLQRAANRLDWPRTCIIGAADMPAPTLNPPTHGPEISRGLSITVRSLFIVP